MGGEPLGSRVVCTHDIYSFVFKKRGLQLLSVCACHIISFVVQNVQQFFSVLQMSKTGTTRHLRTCNPSLHVSLKALSPLSTAPPQRTCSEVSLEVTMYVLVQVCDDVDMTIV